MAGIVTRCAHHGRSCDFTAAYPGTTASHGMATVTPLVRWTARLGLGEGILRQLQGLAGDCPRGGRQRAVGPVPPIAAARDGMAWADSTVRPYGQRPARPFRRSDDPLGRSFGAFGSSCTSQPGQVRGRAGRVAPDDCRASGNVRPILRPGRPRKTWPSSPGVPGCDQPGSMLWTVNVSRGHVSSRGWTHGSGC